MPAAPNASASGERHRTAQEIEAERPRRVSGSVHESPVRVQRMRHPTTREVALLPGRQDIGLFGIVIQKQGIYRNALRMHLEGKPRRVTIEGLGYMDHCRYE